MTTEGIFPFISCFFLSLTTHSSQGSSSSPSSSILGRRRGELLSLGLILFHTLGITGKPWISDMGYFLQEFFTGEGQGQFPLSRVLWALSNMDLDYPGMGHPWFILEIWALRDVFLIPEDSLKYSEIIPWIGIKILNLLISETQNGIKIKKCTFDLNSLGCGGALKPLIIF